MLHHTATDLPVPRSPMMRTPPMLGSMTFNMSASFMSSCSATFTKGREGIRDALPFTSAAAATAQTNCDDPLRCLDDLERSGHMILTHFCSLLEGRCWARRVCEASGICVLPLQDAMPSCNVFILRQFTNQRFPCSLANSHRRMRKLECGLLLSADRAICHVYANRHAMRSTVTRGCSLGKVQTLRSDVSEGCSSVNSCGQSWW